MRRVIQQSAASQGANLEKWETAIREAALSAGARVLGGLVNGLGVGRQDEPLACPDCGQRMVSRGRRTKRLVTVLGDVPYRRARFQCSACGRGLHPCDELLDVVATTRSPGLRRMMARAGSRGTFKEGRDDLKVYAGVRVSAKDVERVAEAIGADMQSWLVREQRRWLDYRPSGLVAKTLGALYIEADGTGVPVVREELAGRRGKQADGSARTREAKLGCVFTQTIVARDGRPTRDPASTSFVGAIESAEDFGWRLYAESVRRGLHQARQVVLLGDAAEWINTLHVTHWPQALRIVDLYHAREHLADLCRLLFAGQDKQITHHRIRWWADLDAGRVEKIAKEASGLLSGSGKARDEAAREIAYLEKNKEYMRYAQFRHQGLFVGSGVVEAGCGTVIGLRMKRSGMEWSVRGANAIIALRCMMASGRLDDYWQSRAG